MKALYMYEHNFIPNLLFTKDKEMSGDFYQHLLFNFQQLSLEVIQDFSKEENVSDIVFATAMKDTFKSEQLSTKEINGVQYNFLKLFFFFQENPDFSPLCPYAYVVLHKVNGKNIYYYFTVEYDSMVNDGNNRGSYWLCRWRVNSDGKLSHKNYGMISLNTELEINKILDIISNNFNVNNGQSSIRYSNVNMKTLEPFINRPSNRKNDNSCFVATATYGDAFHPDVVYLRYFRDKYLNQYIFGKMFIKFYYCVGPYLSLLPKHFLVIKKMSRKLIEKIVIVLKQKYD